MMWVGDEDEADIEDGGTSALTAKPGTIRKLLASKCLSWSLVVYTMSIWYFIIQ